MRRTLLSIAGVACAAASLWVPAARGMPLSATGASQAAAFRAAIQSAPGRQVLPMLGQASVPDTAALPGGGLVLAGNLRGGGLAIVELQPNGRLNPVFGTGGVQLLSIKLLPWQILALPDGALLILGPNRQPGAETPVVRRFPDWQILRLSAHGIPDATFGHDGLLDVSGVPVATEGSGSLEPQLTAGGKVILPTIVGQVLTPAATSGLVRLNPDGSRDASFASGGLLTLAHHITAFSIRLDGSIVLTSNNRPGAQLLGLTANGAPDPSFNGGMPAQLPSSTSLAMLVDSRGGIEILGGGSPPSYSDQIWRYNPNGTLDTSWGSGGEVVLTTGYYFTQLLPAAGGGTLALTQGVPTLMGNDPSGSQLVRLTAGGQSDPTLGDLSGLNVDFPFGGGTYAPGKIANLRQDSYMSSWVIELANGSLLFSGSVAASEAIQTDAGPEALAWMSGFALARLDPSYRLDPTFSGGTRPRVTVRITATHITHAGVSVQLGSSGAAIGVVTVKAAGRTIARGTVPFFSKGVLLTSRTVRVPLNAAGRHLRPGRRLRVTATVSASDLAGNRISARSSRTIASAHA